MPVETGTGGNFDEKLKVVRDPITGLHVVKAGGPLNPFVDRVIELCVWVFQRADASHDDAIANAMGPGTGTEMHEKGSGDMANTQNLGSADARWDMDLDDRDETGPIDYVNGSATAIAIGAFLDNTRSGGMKRRAFVWSEPVELEVQPDTAPA
jgi:hypothetical protein